MELIGELIERIGIKKVFAVVNPRAYFLALAAAVKGNGLMNRWVLFRTPPHPRFLIQAVREAIPLVRAVADRAKIDGGIYAIPSLYTELMAYEKTYHHHLPMPWRECNELPTPREVKKKWESLLSQV